MDRLGRKWSHRWQSNDVRKSVCSSHTPVVLKDEQLFKRPIRKANDKHLAEHCIGALWTDKSERNWPRADDVQLVPWQTVVTSSKCHSSAFFVQFRIRKVFVRSRTNFCFIFLIMHLVYFESDNKTISKEIYIEKYSFAFCQKQLDDITYILVSVDLIVMLKFWPASFARIVEIDSNATLIKSHYEKKTH